MRVLKPEIKITLTYLVFGFLWIIFSDRALDIFIKNTALLTEFQTYKGIFFILITSAFLYLLIRNQFSKINTQKELIDTMFNTISDAVFITNEKDEIILANKGVELTFEYSVKELINTPISQFYFNQDDIKMDSLIHSDYNSNNTQRKYLTDYKTKTARVFPGETFFSTLFSDQGKYLGNVILIRDISEKKALIEELIDAKEKAEASNKLKTAFMNNISHEIRTPLNGLLGFAPLILDPDITAKQKQDYLEILTTCGNRLMQTITDYMDISLLTSGNMEVDKKEFCPAVFFKNICRKYQLQCEKKKILFTLDFPDNFSDLLIYTDKYLLEKIIEHLLDNAVKFTKQGYVSLQFTSTDSLLKIIVKDSGAGINSEALSDIFKDFVQEDINNTRGYEGSGLGLAIIKGIVNLLNAYIHVESSKGIGSTFIVTIPATVRVNNNLENEGIRNTFSGKSKPKILIAEDDSSNLLYLDIILSPSFEIISAYDGNMAVELCSLVKDIHLVIMDIKMPGMNGLMATQEIKKLRADLPVIALTAYTEAGMASICQEAGCDSYLAKPVEKDNLLRELSRFGLHYKE